MTKISVNILSETTVIKHLVGPHIAFLDAAEQIVSSWVALYQNLLS